MNLKTKKKHMFPKKELFNTALFPAFLIIVFAAAALSSCASRGAVQAEEYFAIGMAYYDMGRYDEAEKWLNRARSADRTMTASEYNLGRIAFETGRYEEAAIIFERILSRDPDNVMALKAAAYSRIKNGDLVIAEAHYNRVLLLVPESVDDGFNYALVLYALDKYEDCENVLRRYPHALEENSASLLLLARAQKAQGKIEAVDTYALWLETERNVSPQGLYEYAQVLETAGLYARAIEQYDEAIRILVRDTEDLQKSKLRFEKARILLFADPENEEGMTELNTAISEGFSDTDAIGALLLNELIIQRNRDEIYKILDSMN